MFLDRFGVLVICLGGPVILRRCLDAYRDAGWWFHNVSHIS